jgi:rhodanese-related sulfurtransferase
MFKGWFEGPTIQKIGFEDIGHAIKNPDLCVLINTMSIGEQECLIQNTVPYDQEEQLINDIITKYDHVNKKIIIYGKNAADNSVDRKYRQLIGLGFSNVYIYPGGLFEWVLLQDIYGFDEFPTNKRILDILKYKPPSQFLIPRLRY